MARKPRNLIYREGKVHVLAEKCETCIFRPGNRMDLRPGRVREMIAAARRDESAIVCHSTLGKRAAVCRGFYDLEPEPITSTLQIAKRLGYLQFQEVPR